MIEDHIDPTGEAHTHISNLLRTAVTAAAAMADKRAQRHQRQLQDMERRSEAERRTFTDRLNAERQTAELVYRRAYQDSWWEKARPEDIAAAVGAAGAWAGADPKAADALRHIGEQLHDRHGLDLDELYRAAQDPAAVPEQVHATLTRDTSPRRAGDGPPWHAEVLAAAGETTGRGILESQGWPELAERLDALHVSGEDVAGWLQRAVAQRELGTANDKSLALLWRLKPAQDTTASSTGADVARVAAAGAGAPRPGRDRPGRPAGSFVARQLPNSARRQQQARSGRENGTEAAAG